MKFNVIYNFEEFRNFLKETAKKDSYYLLCNNKKFEKIDKDTILNREVYTLTRKIIKKSSVLKYIKFELQETYSTDELYSFIQLLKEDNEILVTFYNKKESKCTILFIDENNDSNIEQYIRKFIEVDKI